MKKGGELFFYEARSVSFQYLSYRSGRLNATNGSSSGPQTIDKFRNSIHAEGNVNIGIIGAYVKAVYIFLTSLWMIL